MSWGYKKVYTRFYSDGKVRNLTFDEKLIALYLITGQSNRVGLYRISLAAAAEDLGLDLTTFVDKYRRVVEIMNWHYDDINRVLWIPTWWRYQSPDNPKWMKSVLQDLLEVPKSPLLERFYDNQSDLKPSLQKVFQKTIRLILERIGYVSDTYRQRKADASHKEGRRKNKERILNDEETTILPAVLGRFERMWSIYPARNGRKTSKGLALERFAKLTDDDQILAIQAAQHYATCLDVVKGIGIKDAHRWLRNEEKEEPWRDWIEPVKEEVNVHRKSNSNFTGFQYGEREYRAV